MTPLSFGAPRRAVKAPALELTADSSMAAQAREEFAASVLLHRPDVVIIQFGLNDLRFDGSRGHLPISTPEEFGAVIKSDLAYWAKVIKETGISVE